ncbi:Zinc-finger of C2H2 type [Carex littledalei]|uniref:Zinc-finger of C2H2 type n=1 Tax=Carex littledalei TaxID=544730 RepID=A0A833VRL5_9POAL|nr:Zinc-finger of C2H2 type [Carex littledalei]
MEFERRELRDDGRGASFYASSSSATRYPSDAGLSRYGIRALGSSSQRDQVRQLSYNTDSTFLETRRCSGPPGPSLQDPLPAPSYREDLELEICRDRLRERADRFELAHIRMLEAHDRRALAIAERDPYARRIPFYPALPPDNGQIQGERSKVQKDLNVGPDKGPRAGVEGPPILREEVVPHAGLDGSRSHYQPIGPVEAVCPVGPARDVRIDERSGHDPIYQNQFTGYDMLRPPQIIHELPPPLVVPVPLPVPTTQNNIGSSADTNKNRKKEYGQEVIQVKPTMSWSKWPCVWCSVNFDSKEAMDAHLKEQHQGCIGNGPSESEKVENNRNEETRPGLTVMGHDDQKEISEVSGPLTNKKIQLYMPPANLKRKSNELQKGNVVPTPENKEVAGSDTNKKIKLVLPLFCSTRKSDESNKEEVEPTPEDKEIAGSSTTKKIKPYSPPSNLGLIPNERVQTPEEKEIAGSSINRKMKLDLSPSNLKQILDEPSKEEVVQIPENKDIAGSSINRNTKLDLSPSNLKQIPDEPSKEEHIKGKRHRMNIQSQAVSHTPDWVVQNIYSTRTLDDHLQSNAHQEKLNALAYGSLKSEPANKIVAEKPVQGLSQAVAVPKLEEEKEETSKSIPMHQLDKLKEAVSQDKGNRSSSNRMVILTGHKKTAQQTLKFSNSKNGVPVIGIPKPVLVMKNGKWFCNLCEVKLINERSKEEHIKGKRHRMNLQSQAVSHTPEPNEPSAKLSWCYICNVCFTNENGLIAHINEKKHH